MIAFARASPDPVSIVDSDFFSCGRSHNPPNQQQPQGLPRMASQPCRRMRGTITRAAIGSAHLRYQIALNPRPTSDQGEIEPSQLTKSGGNSPYIEPM